MALSKPRVFPLSSSQISQLPGLARLNGQWVPVPQIIYNSEMGGKYTLVSFIQHKTYTFSFIYM